MSPRTRQSTDVRREEIIAAAVIEFADRGLHAASVDAMAQRVGVSQPYVFKLFRTKTALFVACLEHVFDHIEGRFAAAAYGQPVSVETLGVIGDTFRELGRSELLLLLQGFASSGVAEVQQVIERRWMQLLDRVRDIAGTEGDPIQHFFGVGLLHTVVTAANLPRRALQCD